MNKVILFLSIVILSNCAAKESNTRLIKQNAVNDARSRSKEIHLAYLQCYPLSKEDKKACQLGVQHNNKLHERYGASSVEYAKTYDYEAERLGFAEFIRNKGQICERVDQGPKFDISSKTYEVICVDGNNYNMKFIHNNGKWNLINKKGL